MGGKQQASTPTRVARAGVFKIMLEGAEGKTIGSRQVRGHVIGDLFGVHSDPVHGWIVSHLPTGWAVHKRHVASRELGLKMVAALLEVRSAEWWRGLTAKAIEEPDRKDVTAALAGAGYQGDA